MSNEYMPRQDMAAAEWMGVFSDCLLARPGVYHVTPGEAQIVVDAVRRFADALYSANDPKTRTMPIVFAKNFARAQAEDVCRPVYLAIRANKQISDQDKIDAGVRPMKSRYTKRPVPDEPPQLIAGNLTWTRYDVAFRTLHGRRAKPTPTTQLQVFRATGDAPATHVDQAKYFRTVSRGPMGVPYGNGEDGAVTTYFGRWVSARGETGPWSAPLVIRVGLMSVHRSAA